MICKIDVPFFYYHGIAFCVYCQQTMNKLCTKVSNANLVKTSFFENLIQNKAQIFPILSLEKAILPHLHNGWQSSFAMQGQHFALSMGAPPVLAWKHR